VFQRRKASMAGTKPGHDGAEKCFNMKGIRASSLNPEERSAAVVI